MNKIDRLRAQYPVATVLACAGSFLIAANSFFLMANMYPNFRGTFLIVGLLSSLSTCVFFGLLNGTQKIWVGLLSVLALVVPGPPILVGLLVRWNYGPIDEYEKLLAYSSVATFVATAVGSLLLYEWLSREPMDSPSKVATEVVP